MNGKLSVVGTPIGNLEDITLRALRVLKEADVILCEDTRMTKRLLNKYEIRNELLSYHSHSGLAKVDKIISLLEEGKHLALVSDAGTPGISDPGVVLVGEIQKSLPDVVIESVPGPSALTTALSIAGVPTAKFVFLGFLPHKKGRETLFREMAEEERTIVCYESPHRILKTLESLKGVMSERKLVLAHELTKIHEELFRGTPEELLKQFEENPKAVCGEFVMIVEPK